MYSSLESIREFVPSYLSFPIHVNNYSYPKR